MLHHFETEPSPIRPVSLNLLEFFSMNETDFNASGTITK